MWRNKIIRNYSDLLILLVKQVIDYRGMVSTITKQYETTKLKNKLIETNESNKKRQRGNQNPYIEEEQRTQWPKVKVQKDKQWTTKHTYKAKDRVTRTPLKSQVLRKGKQFLHH